VLKKHPCLRPYLKKCVHCGILFLTDPRNIGRNDLGCPFGCRQSYRKNSAARRVKEYYQTKKGKRRKSWLNNASYQKRCGSSKETRHNKSVDDLPPGGLPHKSLLIYLRMLLSIIEERRVALEEIISLLKEFRQRSIDKGEKFGYRYSYTANRPP
jgi:hypothetical protein